MSAREPLETLSQPDHERRFINLPLLRRFSPENYDKSGISVTIFVYVIGLCLVLSMALALWAYNTDMNSGMAQLLHAYALKCEPYFLHLPRFWKTKALLLSMGHSDLWAQLYFALWMHALMFVVFLLLSALTLLRYVYGSFYRNDMAKLAANKMAPDLAIKSLSLGVRLQKVAKWGAIILVPITFSILVFNGIGMWANIYPKTIRFIVDWVACSYILAFIPVLGFYLRMIGKSMETEGKFHLSYRGAERRPGTD